MPFFPGTVASIHLIGACGTAMGATACMLKDLGFRVTGSDQAVYPPMSDFLREKGVTLMEGFTPDHLSHHPDLVIVGNVAGKDNPEVLAAQAKGIPYCSMPQALNRFVADGKKILLVTGTHGKTTTASLLAWILHFAGQDPSFIIGGILKNFSSNYRLGAGDTVVIEGDEYDTAFFDKQAKFFHYPPHAAILGNIEFDHADIYRDLAHVKATFEQFVSRIPRNARLFAQAADPHVREVIRSAGCRVRTFGNAPDADWQITHVRIDGPHTQIDITCDGRPFGTFVSPLMGRHNRANILAVISLCHEVIGLSAHTIQSGLMAFQGVKRRQEVRGTPGGITVMDDFAHHPTAVKETLNAVVPHYTDGRIVAVFEPRTHTSMRNVFQNAYAHAFEPADRIYIRQPPLLSKIPEDIRFSSEQLAADLRSRGKDARSFPDTDAILDALETDARPGDLILIMSNGGFDCIHTRLVKRLAKKQISHR
ncbi:MAG: UDP-N-acetylmuramate:L-alanyl-gamma-D-glutamyl-meso-diaminopimelate ligase [Deltaproteobacteria bacterium]|nr:MAG: UDP-N-acetylmuramate:L-alanyl-gamma-D-glutamyl-meso-diaminopimelate ligase [Deltaproteobacteria bacterium]